LSWFGGVIGWVIGIDTVDAAPLKTAAQAAAEGKDVYDILWIVLTTAIGAIVTFVVTKLCSIAWDRLKKKFKFLN
jgi:hypothetical protein